MDRLTSLLRSRPIFFLLLPLFFVLHGFTENFYAVPVADALLLLLVYLVAATIIFLLASLIFRNRIKAALFSFSLMAVHFFFGGVQDFLKRSFEDAFVTRYSFLIPFSTIAVVALIIFLKRSNRQFLKPSLYLNLLCIVLLLVDLMQLAPEIISPKFKAHSKATREIKCDSCTKPDIYFLVFDEYSSSTALNELWHYDNNELDSFLTQKGFKLLPYSRSNYNFTEFSIASTLNMDWLNIADPKACTVKDYNRCFELIRNNRVVSALQSAGYTISNHSIFDLDKKPSYVHESFLPLRTKLITSQTFLSRIRKDLFFHFLTGKFEIGWLSRNIIYSTKHSNDKMIEGMLKEAASPSDGPKFVYSHIEMPHPPFYFDKNGNEKTRQKLLEENKHPGVQSYLDYLPATNKVLMQLVNNILEHSKRPVVIIVMGDHGYRAGEQQEYYFRNLNAVYSSDGNYRGFSDSMTNINEFRILFNNLFHTDYPVLKDSTIFLKDK